MFRQLIIHGFQNMRSRNDKQTIAKTPETKNQTYDFTFPCILERVFKEKKNYQDKRQELTVHLEDEESSLT